MQNYIFLYPRANEGKKWINNINSGKFGYPTTLFRSCPEIARSSAAARLLDAFGDNAED